jgi:hypothetical protein
MSHLASSLASAVGTGSSKTIQMWKPKLPLESSRSGHRPSAFASSWTCIANVSVFPDALSPPWWSTSIVTPFVPLGPAECRPTIVLQSSLPKCPSSRFLYTHHVFSSSHSSFMNFVVGWTAPFASIQ